MRVKQELIDEVAALIRQGRLDEARVLAGHIKLLEAVFQIPRRNRRLRASRGSES